LAAKSDPAFGRLIPLHDQAMTFATETEELREQARRNEVRLDWLAALTRFKAVLLEGLEVVFIVIALSAGHGMLLPASAGAVAACLLVAGVVFVVHRPLARVPDYGHPGGDAVLCGFSQKCVEAIRPYDIVARVCGESEWPPRGPLRLTTRLRHWQRAERCIGNPCGDACK
jgi:hypothetical protein